MAFNPDQTLQDMLAAVAGVLTGEWPKLKSCIEKALKDESEALQAIAQARIAGEITESEMQSELEDEKLALEAAFLACEVQIKAAAQKAANAAIKVLSDAIGLALKAL